MSKTVWFALCACLIVLTGILPLPAQTLADSHPGDVKRPPMVVETIADLVEQEGAIRAGLLYDAERGVVVWAKQMHRAYPIASLTKMMVALLAAEDVRAGRVDWSDEITVKRLYKTRRRRRRVYRSAEIYTLEALLQLAMIPSNNQACGDIATYLDGNLRTFVKRMNDKARSLGMKSTTYFNPSGLPGNTKKIDNTSSPHDLLLLALEMLKFDELLKITSSGFAEISNNKRTGVFRNHNRLVIDYEQDVDGLKTGYTRRAKFCLVATANKAGHRLISVVLGVYSPSLRNEIVASMLNKYYTRIGFGPMALSSDAPVARPSLISTATADEALAAADRQVSYKTVWAKQRQPHTVRGGETLSSIAKRYRVTYQQLKKWNHLTSDTILKGQKLTVYARVQKKVALHNANAPDNEDETVSDDQNGALTESVLPPPDGTYVYYIVQPGDTLWDIAKHYAGITAADIKQTNNITNSRRLKPGTRLKIRVVPERPPELHKLTFFPGPTASPLTTSTVST